MTGASVNDCNAVSGMSGQPQNRPQRRRGKSIAADPPPLLCDDGARFVVYLYRDPRPRKKNAPIYVGKGTSWYGRPDDHWSNKNRSHNPLFGNVLSKIRSAGLKPIVEIIAAYDEEADAFYLEKALIKRFGRRDLGTGTLCNLTDGGEGPAGRIVSVETRAKMSASQVARFGKMTPAERSAIAIKANASRTPEERSAIMVAVTATISRETLRDRAAKARAVIGQLGTEEYSARVRAGLAKQTPEERSERCRTREQKKTPEERSEIARKRYLKMTPDERKMFFRALGQAGGIAARAKTTSAEYSARGMAGALTRWRK